jgi:uncharacterized protein DUF3306
MSDLDNFLSRWSRRKREVLREAGMGVSFRRNQAMNSSPPTCEEGKVNPSGVGGAARGGTALPQPPDAPPSPAGSEGEAPARPVPAPIGLAFDPASLPSIQSITAETDIRSFLGAGVPSELTRAALRRAWACDPKIRNFVGLAEYDWDFNAADSMAGFGPLQMTDDVRKMAAQIMEPNHPEPGVSNLLDPNPTPPRAEPVAGKTDADIASGAAAEMHDQVKHRDEPANEIGTPPHPNELTRCEHGPIATQHTTIKPDKRNVFVKRHHGGALPK